jgi:hypothetical protein
MDKLTIDFQKQFKDDPIYDRSVFANIDKGAKLHDQTEGNPLSSAAACLNVLGSMMNSPDELKRFLNTFGLNIRQLLAFPSGADVGGLKYNDKGYVVFEWIGPKESPINEWGGGRGQNRTSIDAYVIAEINGTITQLFIEWKFTEGKSWPLALERFSGLQGLERLRRYADILTQWRGTPDFPFNFQEDGGLGICDFSVDHLYQLLRMTLLAKKTTPIRVGGIDIKDYRIIHLSHSQNDKIRILQKQYLKYSPGLEAYVGHPFHDTWRSILSEKERGKFTGGSWDLSLNSITDAKLRDFLLERYR